MRVVSAALFMLAACSVPAAAPPSPKPGSGPLGVRVLPQVVFNGEACQIIRVQDGRRTIYLAQSYGAALCNIAVDPEPLVLDSER